MQSIQMEFLNGINLLTINMEKIILSEWMPDPSYDYCCMRIVLGTDPKEVSNRVAFIEKCPRVRIAPFTNKNDDWQNWLFGEKGPGGANGSDPENELYGYYPPSRQWCDNELLKMGYILS